MRVAVFAGLRDTGEGGGDTLRQSLLGALAQGDWPHQFTVFEQDPDKPSKMPRRLRSALERLGVLTPVPSFEDVCLASAPFDMAWFIKPLAPPLPIPFIATVWDLEHLKQPYFPEVSESWEAREKVFRALLPRAARILTCTETGQQEVVRFYGVPPERVKAVPHPASPAVQGDEDAGEIRRRYGLQRPFVFYPAQFWAHKNHVNLLLGLKAATEAGSPIDLVLTGGDKGNAAHVRAWVAKLGLESHVHMLGFVSMAELGALYREARGLVYATLFGPDNLPPLEAFASGCPVAASDIPGASEQLGDAALLFDPLDPAAIGRAIRTLADDDAQRQLLVQRGAKRVAGLTPHAYVARVCDILDEFEPLRRCWGD